MTTSSSSWLKLRWLFVFLMLAIGSGGTVSWWWLIHRPNSAIAAKPEVIASLPSIGLPSRAPSQIPVLTPMGAPTVTPVATLPISQPPAPLPITTATPNPTSTLTPTSTPTAPPAITNGDFTHGLTAWQTQGEVKVLPVDSPAQTSAPFLARLGSQTNLAWLGTHQLSQTFSLKPETSTLQFWYRLWTEETNLGFDDPALVVMLDDQVIWRVGAPAAWPSQVNLLSLATAIQPATTGWKLISLPLARFVTDNQAHVLRFLAGQTGDQNLASWADVSQVSLVATLPEPDLTIPGWWPAAFSLEWPEFAQITSFVAHLPPLDPSTTWQELLSRRQGPVEWQSQTLTSLGQIQTHQWRPAEWLVDVAQSQPTFTFPFSLSYEGFTGPLLTDPTASNSPIPPQSSLGIAWNGWATVWNLLGKPQGLIWLDESGQ